jgi:hypothetical protein
MSLAGFTGAIWPSGKACTMIDSTIACAPINIMPVPKKLLKIRQLGESRSGLSTHIHVRIDAVEFAGTRSRKPDR